MGQITIKKLTVGSVFKIFFIGFAAFFIPFGLLCGILGAFGMNTVLIDGEAVKGIKALFYAPLMSTIVSLLFSAVFGSICALGLMMWSFLKPLTIKFITQPDNKQVD